MHEKKREWAGPTEAEQAVNALLSLTWERRAAGRWALSRGGVLVISHLLLLLLPYSYKTSTGRDTVRGRRSSVCGGKVKTVRTRTG